MGGLCTVSYMYTYIAANSDGLLYMHSYISALPHMDKHVEVFESLHDLIKEANTHTEVATRQMIDSFETNIFAGKKLLLSLSAHCDGYQPSCITHYMHTMVFHSCLNIAT